MKNSGTETVNREQFKMSRIEGETLLKTSFSNFRGRISKGQVEGFIFIIISVREDGEIGLNEQRETAQGFSTVMGESDVENATSNN